VAVPPTRLSYKHSDEREWTKVVHPPTQFQCPPGIAEADDYCYDLKDLEYGKQYTSDVGLALPCLAFQ
jgi:hypothetical protein